MAECCGCHAEIRGRKWLVPVLSPVSLAVTTSPLDAPAINTIEVCSQDCAKKIPIYMRREETVRIFGVPPSFVGVGKWQALVEVPDAEPPEWYAACLAEVEQALRTGPLRDERTNWERAHDEWKVMERRDIRAEDYERTGGATRHEVWR